MTIREITLTAGDIAIANNIPRENETQKVLVLYPSPGNAVEIIPYDGDKIIGMIGGGILAKDIIEIIGHLEEDDYVKLISRGKVGQESEAREIYKRPPITYAIPG